MSINIMKGIIQQATNDQLISYRYIKWHITGRKGTGTDYYSNIVQVSEFTLRLNGSDISMSGATVTNPGGDNPAAEGPENLCDNDTSTKWLDFLGANNPVSSTLIIDMGASTTFDGYRWATANDAENRDPTDWTISGSDDNSTYTTLATVSSATITSSRFTYVGPYELD